jgi:uncharacterized protein YecE (DUF72 family)
MGVKTSDSYEREVAMKIKIGTCGWGFYKGGLKAYQKKFSLCEVQQTFYRLPMVKTVERWRAESPEDFEFTVKAFQGLTHLPTSPTWRRSGLKQEELKQKQFGWLRPTKDNFEAWRRTKEICEALGSRICVIQCPPNFNCTAENIGNMREFLGEIDRGELELAWEPRGDWHGHPDEVASLCDELKLIHVVDLMRREPLSRHPIAYTRLHGLNPREYDYNYKYSRDELEELARRLKKLARRHREVYCLFNNYAMYDSAQALQLILGRKTG